jgi:SAM-dependent methyltransferase
MNQSKRQWDARYLASESVWSLEPNEFVVEYLSTVLPGKMLDLGGGEGRNALWFANLGWSVENSDFSDVAIGKFLERATRAGLSNRCTGTVSSALEQTACRTAPVDLAVIAYLQLDPMALAKAIAIAATALRPGGTLFGVWHERGNITRGIGGPQIPNLNPTVDELRRHSIAAGLTINTCEVRERVVLRDDGPVVAIDVVLVASG